MEQKIAFFLDKENLNKQDYSKILDGNPGIGGSEYEFLLVSYLLEQRENGINPILLTRSKQHFPHKNVQYINSLNEACIYCIEHQIPSIVINQGQFDRSILEPYKKNISFILWAHNTMPYPKLSLLSHLDYVKRIVCCGREMMDLYRDHIATLKSTYIYNIFPTKNKEWYLNEISPNNNHNVVYMGCLAPGKGFHVLARSWKNVLKKVPDAQLYVIGSGRLYDANEPLGKYGLASEEYENLFMSYLIDENGELHPSVHFLGLLGAEKFSILGQCKVGVPNPTGNTECLPITTIEMQLMGCKIVTIKHPAYIDTVYNHNYLYAKTSDLANYIIKALLSEQRDSYNETYQFITSKFGIESNIKRWEETIKNLNSFNIEKYSDKSYQMKPLKDFLLQLKKTIPFLNNLPPIEKFYNFYRNKISKSNQ